LNTPIRFFPRLVWAAFGLGLITFVLAPPLILISFFSSATAVYRIERLWAVLVSKFFGITSSIKGRENITPGTSYIITPNHQSHAEILALLTALPVKFRWVVKKELLNVPLFGHALARTGAISIDRSNREKSIKSLQDAAEKLKDGWSVLIYPEGTRTPDGNIHEFKKGAFMMAIQTSIPILPVTCNGAYKVMPRNTLAITPGHIEIVVGTPFSVQGLAVDDCDELMKKTREEVISNFEPQYSHLQQKTGT